MNKNYKMYSICWAILLAVFNIICFATPKEAIGMNKFGGAFWAGYVLITLSFLGQLACAYFAFKAENLKKLFYNLPMITVSYSGLILTIILGGLCMAIPNIPNWIGIIVCMLILAFTAIAVIKAKAASDIIEKIDEKIAVKTQFIKTYAVEAQNIMNRAKSDAIKSECKKIYETLRYSDPMSSENLKEIEEKISLKLAEFSISVDKNDEEAVKTNSEELANLIKERNNKCKELK